MIHIIFFLAILTGSVHAKSNGSSWSPPFCSFGNYMVSSETTDYCSMKDVCDSMNAEPVTLTVVAFKSIKHEVLQSLKRCVPTISNIWIFFETFHKVLNESYNVAIKELKTIRQDSDYCNQRINICARELRLDSNFCGPESLTYLKCCNDYNHAFCRDVNECESGNFTCELPPSWPCDTNLTCVNTVGSYDCVLPAPRADVICVSNTTALLRCNSFDTCIRSLETSLSVNIIYTWFKDGILETFDSRDHLVVMRTNATKVYKCMVTVNETTSLNSSSVYINNTVEDLTPCGLYEIHVNNTHSELFSLTEHTLSDIETETETTNSYLQKSRTQVTSVQTDISASVPQDGNSSYFLSTGDGTNALDPLLSTTPHEVDDTTARFETNKVATTSDKSTFQKMPEAAETSTSEITTLSRENTMTSEISYISRNLYIQSSQEMVISGSSALLRCSIPQDDLLVRSYRWTKDSKVFASGTENTLTINNFTPSKEGVYACQADVFVSGEHIMLVSTNTARLILLTRYQTCPCFCSNTSVEFNLTKHEVDASLRAIKKHLLVDTETLHSTVRRKTSASDQREVSQFVGALSVITLFSILALVVASDLLGLFLGILTRLKKFRFSF